MISNPTDVGNLSMKLISGVVHFLLVSKASVENAAVARHFTLAH